MFPVRGGGDGDCGCVRDIGLHGPSGATMSSAGGFCPGKLWSLWDMLRLYSQPFLRALDDLAAIRVLIHNTGGTPSGLQIYQAELADLGAATGSLIAQLEALQLPMTTKSAQRLYDHFGKTSGLDQDTLNLINDVTLRLEDELSGIALFGIKRHAELYEPDTPLFGEAVADKFPLAIPDIEDAGKCLALEQGTACVFHLMRIMEVGLKSLANLLGIPYAPSWESYIKQIQDKIGEKHDRKGVDWKCDEPFFRDVLGDLQSIKICWRNPTMHVVRRYSPDEADQIFGTVRTFMKRLADRL